MSRAIKHTKWIPIVGMRIKKRFTDPHQTVYRVAIIKDILPDDVLRIIGEGGNRQTLLARQTWNNDWSPFVQVEPAQLPLPSTQRSADVFAHVRAVLNFCNETNAENTIPRNYPTIFDNVVCHCGHRFAEHSEPPKPPGIHRRCAHSCGCIEFHATPRMLVEVSDSEFLAIIDAHSKSDTVFLPKGTHK